MAGGGAGLGSISGIAEVAGQGRVREAATALEAVGDLIGAGLTGLGQGQVL